VDKSPHLDMESFPKSQSLDEEDVADTYHQSLKGHTKNDKADMSRMGKIQELRVLNLALLHQKSRHQFADNSILEKLPSFVGFGLYRHHSGNMGGSHDVCILLQ
jgi:hypothetical protein